ncbi:hypothetical protein CR203_05960 [Salipaludibacillus neizhouensis]|uniref:SGNH domain-containing protein n=1 Tax=Salipaludibacillus neizhouensis TaxID=885475 RepID=A0A3A9KBA2_9BACI|nr:SGNH hydrolase domain-containing protein [Salipaludibacillus neizhouensis]RKL68040.1 hypothetical protein CR203_05960 [Salipaludibacillus neizhouensis]
MVKPIKKLNKSTIFVSLLVLALVVAGGWFYVNSQNEQEQQTEVSIENKDYPGAAALHEDIEFPDDVPVLPEPLEAKEDLPIVYGNGCHQNQTDSDVIACEYGVTDDPDYTVALVGSSHAAHWLDALERVAEHESIKIISYTKSACLFTSLDDELTESCLAWSDNMVEHLSTNKPDIVITTADVKKEENVPEGFLERWDKLNEEGIPVFAIRDNPWMGMDVAECVAENKDDLSKCAVERDEVLLKESAWSRLENPPENVYYADFSNYICGDELCEPVIGNVLVYRDAHHLTATYSRTLAPYVREELMKALAKVE